MISIATGYIVCFQQSFANVLILLLLLKYLMHITCKLCFTQTHRTPRLVFNMLAIFFPSIETELIDDVTSGHTSVLLILIVSLIKKKRKVNLIYKYTDRYLNQFGLTNQLQNLNENKPCVKIISTGLHCTST